MFNTPLRYPGGKQRLTPFINEIINVNEISGNYVEPYAGGAGVAIKLLLSRKIKRIHLNDSYRGIYAFWHSVVNQPEELCSLISKSSLTVDEWKKRKSIVKNAENEDLLNLGYSVLYLNRCNRSGVLSAGVIGGLDQTGNYKMDARFSRTELIRRVEAIAIFKDQISITNFDAEYYIDNYIPNIDDDTLVYFDPPYFEKGSELYLNSYNKDDHKRLGNIIQNNVNHKWILSYDGVPEIIEIYNERRYFEYDLQYSVGKNYKGKEVFVFSDILTLPPYCKLENIQMGLNNLVLP